jgi:hypothetical protein
VETHVITQDYEIQKCAFCQQSDVDAVLDFNGPFLQLYQDCGQMVNSAWYCVMLEEELKSTITENRAMLALELFCIMTIINLIWQQQVLK